MGCVGGGTLSKLEACGSKVRSVWHEVHITATGTPHVAVLHDRRQKVGGRQLFLQGYEHKRNVIIFHQCNQTWGKEVRCGLKGSEGSARPYISGYSLKAVVSLDI